jgi:hypothetical protein
MWVSCREREHTIINGWCQSPPLWASGIDCEWIPKITLHAGFVMWASSEVHATKHLQSLQTTECLFLTQVK